MIVMLLVFLLQVADHPGAFVIAHGGFSRKVVSMIVSIIVSTVLPCIAHVPN